MQVVVNNTIRGEMHLTVAYGLIKSCGIDMFNHVSSDPYRKSYVAFRLKLEFELRAAKNDIKTKIMQDGFGKKYY